MTNKFILLDPIEVGGMYPQECMQLTEQMQHLFPYRLEIGKWVAVNVHESGYSFTVCPIPMTKKQCQKFVNHHNESLNK